MRLLVGFDFLQPDFMFEDAAAYRQQIFDS